MAAISSPGDIALKLSQDYWKVLERADQAILNQERAVQATLLLTTEFVEREKLRLLRDSLAHVLEPMGYSPPDPTLPEVLAKAVPERLSADTWFHKQWTQDNRPEYDKSAWKAVNSRVIGEKPDIATLARWLDGAGLPHEPPVLEWRENVGFLDLYVDGLERGSIALNNDRSGALFTTNEMEDYQDLGGERTLTDAEAKQEVLRRLGLPHEHVPEQP